MTINKKVLKLGLISGGVIVPLTFFASSACTKIKDKVKPKTPAKTTATAPTPATNTGGK